MKTLIFASLLLFGMLAATYITGCVAMRSDYRSVTERETVGRGTTSDIRHTVPRLFNRHNFEIYREEDTMDGFYFESEWKERDPFEDEQDNRVTQVRNKIYVNTRPSGAAGELHRIRFEGIIEVIIDDSGGWVDTLMTAQAREYFGDLIQDYRDEFSVSGVRRN